MEKRLTLAIVLTVIFLIAYQQLVLKKYVPPPKKAAATESVVVRTSPAPAPAPVARTLGGILLQVASFSSRDNAARALGQLSSAGIAGASLSDVVSGGRTLWRLRVNADDLTSATELAGRIAGLGFGKPQIVRD